MLYSIATDVNSELYQLGFSPCCLLSVPKPVNSELYPLGFRLCCLLSVPKAVNSAPWLQTLLSSLCSQGCQLCTLASDLVVFSLFPRLSTLHPGFRPCCLLSVPKAVNSALWLQSLLSSLCSQGCQLCTLASVFVVFSLFPRLSTLHSGFRLCCLLFVPKAVNSELCMLASDLVFFLFPKAVNSELCTLGFSPVHGPILLGWAMVRHFYLEEDQSDRHAVETHRDAQSSKDAAETHKLGNKALQLGVFKVILDLLGTEPFTGSSVSWFWFV